MIKKHPPPCLFEISAYYILRTLPISGGVCFFWGNGQITVGRLMPAKKR